MICPSCSAVVPDGARFCPTCGHAQGGASDERRVVTVLFGDLVGFTTMAEARDPEQVKNMVDACFERLAADITSFGGRVDKVVGDAVVALFGAPLAHEDDAERAVRAALAMQRSLAALADEAGVAARMRIGVNTGEVLVGALRAGGDYTAMGDVVNIASRLQTAAQPGQVVVGPETWAATRDVFRYEHLGPVAARGREQEVPAWAAIEAVSAPGRRRARRRTPLLGRGAEMGLLCHAMRAAITNRRPQLAVIVGEAGMGKSRLAEEVATAAREEHGALVLEGRSVPYGEANVWWPVAEALRQASGIEPDDSAADARAKCLTVVAAATGVGREAPETARTAEGLLYVMGYEGRFSDVDPGRGRDEVHRAVRTFFEGLAGERAVVLVVSDVQWADALVLELVDDLFERLHRLPLVVLLTARPELEPRWRPRSGRHNLVVLNLDPLDREAAASLVNALIDGDVDGDVEALLIERSGGNPFFLEELAGLLAETGALVSSTGSVPILPATLRGLVAARLDSLPPEQRSVVEDAAVLGRRGPLAALEALALARGRLDGLPAALEALAAKDFLVVTDGQCGFGSDVVREVAYGTLTKAERARRHALLASWIEGRASEKERTDELLEELARHWGAAAELVADVGLVDGVPPDVRARGLDALQRAAERAEDRETHLVSARLFDQQLRLVGRQPGAERRHALIGRARARTALRQSELAHADLDAALREAEEAGDEVAAARALLVQGDLERNEGDLAASLETLDRALASWQRLGDRRGEAGALRRQGMTHLFAGDLQAAEVALLDALRVFSATGSRRGVAWAKQHLAWLAFYRGEQDVAEARLNDSIALFADIGDWGGLGWSLGLMAWVQFTQGHRAEAERLAVQTVNEAREQGDTWAIGMMEVLLAAVRLWQGRAGEAVTRAREARRVFRDLGDPWGECRALAPLSRALVVLGDRDGAYGAVDDVRALRAGIPGDDQQQLVALLEAGVAVHAGEGGRALAAFGGDGGGGRDGGAPAELGMVAEEAGSLLGLALVQEGRPAEAETLLDASLRRATDVGPRAATLAALALARAAAGRSDEALASADEVAALDGGTYLDLVQALLARACAAARRGDHKAALAPLDEATALLLPTDDRLTPAITALARARVLEALGSDRAGTELAAARDGFADLGTDAAGWDTAFRLATGLREAEAEASTRP